MMTMYIFLLVDITTATDRERIKAAFEEIMH